MRTSAQNWNRVLLWDRLAAEEKRTGHITPKSDWQHPGYWPVFCASLADVFDNEVPEVWRHDLWKLMLSTPNLSWLLVTKRIGNVAKMWPVMQENPPPNVRLLITVCNQEEADRDIPKLLALPCKNGISYEPALGPVAWQQYLQGTLIPGVQWIIIGGESDPQARPFDLAWARSTMAQCKAVGVRVFCKQLGSRAGSMLNAYGGTWEKFPTKDRAGADPSEWPSDLNVRQFPI